MRITHPYRNAYRELIALIPVTQAEATIAWFYSGKRQPLIINEVRIPVYADSEYDCTDKIQQLLDLGGGYLPEGVFSVQSPLTIDGGQFIAGTVFPPSESEGFITMPEDSEIKRSTIKWFGAE